MSKHVGIDVLFHPFEIFPDLERLVDRITVSHALNEYQKSVSIVTARPFVQLAVALVLALGVLSSFTSSASTMT